MAPDPSPEPGGRPDVEARLHDIAKALRDARHLDPETQRSLADLVDELGDALDPTHAGQSAVHAHVADSAAALARALRQPNDTGLIAAARSRLEEAAARAEVEAPLATGILRRLIDALSNIGI